MLLEVFKNLPQFLICLLLAWILMKMYRNFLVISKFKIFLFWVFSRTRGDLRKAVRYTKFSRTVFSNLNIKCWRVGVREWRYGGTRSKIAVPGRHSVQSSVEYKTLVKCIATPLFNLSSSTIRLFRKNCPPFAWRPAEAVGRQVSARRRVHRDRGLPPGAPAAGAPRAERGPARW